MKLSLARSMFEAALYKSRRFRRLLRTVVMLTAEFEKLVAYTRSISEAVERHEQMLRQVYDAHGEIMDSMQDASLDLSLPEGDAPKDKKDLPN